MIKKNGKHKSPYHEAYAIIGELKKRPNDPKLVQRALRSIFDIIISDPNSTATMGEEKDVLCRGFRPAFRFESVSVDSRDSIRPYWLTGKYAVVNGGMMMQLTDPTIPYLGRYVSIAASNGRSYRHFKMSMRRFLTNLKAIDGDASISAYCMMRGVDLRYDPK